MKLQQLAQKIWKKIKIGCFLNKMEPVFVFQEGC